MHAIQLVHLNHVASKPELRHPYTSEESYPLSTVGTKLVLELPLLTFNSLCSQSLVLAAQLKMYQCLLIQISCLAVVPYMVNHVKS